MPECDDPSNPIYDQPWVHHALPGTRDTNGIFTPKQCSQFTTNISNTTNLLPPLHTLNDTCPSEWFTRNEAACSKFVFEDYEHTIVQEVNKIYN